MACNFEAVAGEEWKIMGLAPYGRMDQELYERLKAFYSVDGLTINCTSASLRIFTDLISKPVSHKKDFEKAANYAFTFQSFYTETVSAVLNELQARTGEDNLVLTGGCALNSSYNGRVLHHTEFKRVYIPSAPADDGNAAGAAILASTHYNESLMLGTGFQSPYLGSEIDEEELEALLENSGCLDFMRCKDDVHLCEEVAALLAAGNVVAWVQGRAEYGPRALGNRSILADPRDPGMKDKVNRVVKFREAFRPFAPSILDEYGHEYFSEYHDSPYMERTLEIRPEKRGDVPAVCHADGTGRLQSVTQKRNPL
ncbi:MAG: carbamoyltransferase C-terminal domain-containing protein, partial [Nitrososphaera sp.]